MGALEGKHFTIQAYSNRVFSASVRKHLDAEGTMRMLYFQGCSFLHPPALLSMNGNWPLQWIFFVARLLHERNEWKGKITASNGTEKAMVYFRGKPGKKAENNLVKPVL